MGFEVLHRADLNEKRWDKVKEQWIIYFHKTSWQNFMLYEINKITTDNLDWTFIFCSFAPSLTYSCLWKMRPECHSVICQSRPTVTHTEYVRFQWKPVHNPKSVFVCGVQRCRSWWNYVLHTDAMHCTEQWPKPLLTVTWSMKLMQAKGEMFS